MSPGPGFQDRSGESGWEHMAQARVVSCSIPTVGLGADQRNWAQISWEDGSHRTAFSLDLFKKCLFMSGCLLEGPMSTSLLQPSQSFLEGRPTRGAFLR